jgi:hypothetical protein
MPGNGNSGNGNVVKFPRRRRHARASAKVNKSGRSSVLGMPVMRSTSSTRSAGILDSSQRKTVLLSTPNTSPNCSSVSGGSEVIRYDFRGLSLLMTQHVAPNATACQVPVAREANDWGSGCELPLRMARTTKKITKIHTGKQPNRIHYIVEWAERRGVTQADIVRNVHADKATVSRWFAGVIPSEEYLEPLAGYLELDDVECLFRHPDDDWVLRHFKRASKDTQEDIRAILDRVASRGA